MKKLTALLLAAVLLLTLAACSGEPAEAEDPPAETTEAEPEEVPETTPETEPESESETEPTTEPATEPATEPEPETVTSTDALTIDALAVDDSYVDDDGSPLKMVYLFYTVTAGDANLEVDSAYTDVTINETNTYTCSFFPNDAVAKYTSSYYYSEYIEDVYVGESLKILCTFEVPEGDLAAGRTITFSDSQVEDFAELRMTTDDIQHFATPEELAQALDPEGYAAEMTAREPASAELAAQVDSLINGYYWSFYVNSISYELEFYGTNNFQVRTSLGTTSDGTYTITNGYIMCTYPDTGYTVEIPYELVDGDVQLDVADAFDVNM